MNHPGVLLSTIRQGMAVIDRQGDEIGTVVFSYGGEVEYRPESDFVQTRTMEAQDQVATNRLPFDVQERLLTYGFVKIRTGGLFLGTRFLTPDQIWDMDPENNRLYLYADGGELRKG